MYPVPALRIKLANNVLFFRLMEKDVEARLREKFALFDKSDIEQMAEAQKVLDLTLKKNNQKH